MKFVASAFKFLNEVAFFLLAVIVPVLVGVGYFSGSNIGDISTTNPVWLIVWLVVYMIVLVSVFGFIALVIENNQHLQNVVEELRKLNATTQRSEPKFGSGISASRDGSPRLSSSQNSE
jgi:hypothetical protein